MLPPLLTRPSPRDRDCSRSARSDGRIGARTYSLLVEPTDDGDTSPLEGELLAVALGLLEEDDEEEDDPELLGPALDRSTAVPPDRSGPVARLSGSALEALRL